MKKREKGVIHIPRGGCETHEDLEYLVGNLATITRGSGGSEEDKESATDNENQHTDSRQVCRHEPKGNKQLRKVLIVVQDAEDARK